MAGLSISPVTDGVVVAELDRGPDNLWSLTDLRELVALLEAPPEGAHVLRVRSVGEAFCRGRERGGTSTAPGVVRGEAETLVAVTRAFRRTRLVTVAEVQGDAAGFGVGVLAACDVAVAVADARFSFPEVGIGLAPALVLAWLPRKVGERQGIVAAAGENVVYDPDEPGQRLPEPLGVARVFAEEKVGSERGRSPVLHEPELLCPATHLDAV